MCRTSCICKDIGKTGSKRGWGYRLCSQSDLEGGRLWPPRSEMCKTWFEAAKDQTDASENSCVAATLLSLNAVNDLCYATQIMLCARVWIF